MNIILAIAQTTKLIGALIALHAAHAWAGEIIVLLPKLAKRAVIDQTARSNDRACA